MAEEAPGVALVSAFADQEERGEKECGDYRPGAHLAVLETVLKDLQNPWASLEGWCTSVHAGNSALAGEVYLV